MRRLIDACNLMEHAGRDRLDSRELIFQMIENAPTEDPKAICEEEFTKALREKKEQFRPTERDSDWWYNRKAGIVDGLEIAYETFKELFSEKGE